MIPEFLHCDDGDSDREFVLHTQEPRILIEFMNDKGTIAHWLDDREDFLSRSKHAGKEPAQEIARILREAGEFYLEN